MLTKKPVVVTFTGKAGHGKSSSALMLKQMLENSEYRVLSIHYADYLKFVAKQYLVGMEIRMKKEEPYCSSSEWIS